MELVQQLLAMRQREIVPRLAGAAFGKAHAADSGLLTANWRMGDGAVLRLEANLSDNAIAHRESKPIGVPIWGGETGETMPPWSVFWRLESR
jgi:maltooligosyltrehalose trehalohydrolase